MLYLNNHKDVMLLSAANCNLGANWRKIGFILEVDSLQKHTIILLIHVLSQAKNKIFMFNQILHLQPRRCKICLSLDLVNNDWHGI